MKRVIGLVFVISLILSIVVIAQAARSAPGFAANSQIGYLKRKTRKVSHRVKYKSKYVGHKTAKGTRWASHKTKRGTKYTYVKTKHGTKRVYVKTKDAVQ